MKFILEIKNYDCNRLYVNTDIMKFALEEQNDLDI